MKGAAEGGELGFHPARARTCQRGFSARSGCPQPGMGLWGSRQRERRVQRRGKPGLSWFRQPPTESSVGHFARL